ncbi:PsiF family protein [Chitinivorax sp. PXF-14]|uniref:PsiF family protein n=1 Tax=Chitinivorax sp. PXF-14 TaxID=3230488 RepID=UPI0034667218
MKLIAAMIAGLMLTATAAHAADAPTKQQSKMAMCNKDAEGKKGDERKAFMSNCLKDKKKAQQEKMKSCNKDAAGKKGDERKQFMSDCLKKEG